MSLKRNSLTTIVSAIVPAIATLFLTPLYLKVIGQESYGVMALIWLLLGYFGVFEGGLGIAISQKISTDNSDLTKRSERVGTALALAVILAAIGSLVMVPLAYYYFKNYGQSFTGNSRIYLLIGMLCVGLLLANISSVIGGAIRSASDLTSYNVIVTFASLAFQITPLITGIYISTSVEWLVVSAVAARALPIPILYFLMKKLILGDQKPLIAMRHAREMVHFGLWVSVSSILTPLMTALDRFIIGAIKGPASVAAYTLALQLSDRVAMVPSAILSPYFPLYARSSGDERISLKKRIYFKYNLITVGLASCTALVADPFLRFWVGASIASEAGNAASLVAVGFWANSLARLSYAHLQAEGRPHTVAKCHLIEAPIYLVFLYFSIKYGGLLGAAAAYSSRCILDMMLLAYVSGDIAISWRANFFGFIAVSAASTFAIAISNG